MSIDEESREEVRKLELGLPYLLKHNQEHVKDLKKWIRRARNGHQDEVANDLKKVLELSRKITCYLETALNKLKLGVK
jgi:hypothetical protein